MGDGGVERWIQGAAGIGGRVVEALAYRVAQDIQAAVASELGPERSLSVILNQVATSTRWSDADDAPAALLGVEPARGDRIIRRPRIATTRISAGLGHDTARRLEQAHHA